MRRCAWMVPFGVVGVVVLAVVGLRGQVPGQAPATISPDEWPTFRAGTRLATVDAVVVDAQGRHVTDLKPGDFEVVERGATPRIHQALYVRVGGAATVTDAAPMPPAVPADRAPAPQIRRLARAGGSATVRAGTTPRVVAIVVDDLGLSFESTAHVRRMLTRYVDEVVRPSDLVAIIRTAGGVGALQQFTTDRRLLHAAIERVRWTVHSRSGVGAFRAVEPVPIGETRPPGQSSRFPRPGEMRPPGLGEDGSMQADDATVRAELTTAGTLGALEYVVRGIDALPGRKSVVFVSEGFDLGVGNHKASRTWSAFTRVMDRANRAGVVVYTLDARGLQTGALTAEDNPQLQRNPYTAGSTAPASQRDGNGGEADEAFRKLVTHAGYDRARTLLDSQDALVYMAEQTGGFAVMNTNDLGAGLERIVDDTQGYYLIGFETLIPVGVPWDPNDIRVRVKRPGLTVRARRGLFGPSDPARPRDPIVADPLVAAALSPFHAGAIDVRLTTLFAHDPKAGAYVRSLFFVDPAGLTFVDGPDGARHADLTLLLLAIGDNGRAVGQSRIAVPLRLDAAGYALLQQRGLLYSARLPIKAPGGYQVRAAVQDDRSRAVGSSAQFVEVPKVGKGQVALSGVVLMDVASAAAQPAPLATLALSDGVLGEPAVKIFRPGSEVAYTCVIYDGRRGGGPAVSTTATLLRDGKPVYTSEPASVSTAERGSTLRAVPIGGRLSLGPRLTPGAYTLQVSLTPADGASGPRATQWAEFEVR